MGASAKFLLPRFFRGYLGFIRIEFEKSPPLYFSTQMLIILERHRADGKLTVERT